MVTPVFQEGAGLTHPTKQEVRVCRAFISRMRSSHEMHQGEINKASPTLEDSDHKYGVAPSTVFWFPAERWRVCGERWRVQWVHPFLQEQGNISKMG